MNLSLYDKNMLIRSRDENSALSKKVSDLNSKIKDLETYSRCDSIVLLNHNISADSESDILESDVVQLLSSKCNTHVHSSDVSVVHQLGKPMVGLVDNSPSILIKFSRRLS